MVPFSFKYLRLFFFLFISVSSLAFIQAQDIAGLNAKAMAFHKNGQHDSAIICGEKVMSLLKDKEGTSYITCLNNLALYYKGGEQYQKSAKIYRESLELTEKKLGKEHAKYGACLDNLAMVYKDMGMFDKALPLSLEALSHAERTLGKDNSTYMNRLADLGLVYMGLEDFENSLTCLTSAVELSGKIAKPDREEVFNAKVSLSELYRFMGQSDIAVQFVSEIMTSVDKNSGKENRYYENCLTILSASHFELGRYDKALQPALEALEISGRIYGKGHTLYGTRLITIGKIYAKKKEFPAALEYYNQALTICEAVHGKNHQQYATLLNDLGDFYVEAENLRLAEKTYTEALDITKNTLGTNHPTYAARLYHLANFMVRERKYDPALNLLRQSKAVFDKVYGKNHPNYAFCVNTMALLCEKQGKSQESISLMKEAMHCRLKDIERNFTSLSEINQGEYVRKMNSYFEIGRSFYWRNLAVDPSLAGEMYNLELASKGIVLHSGIDMRKRMLHNPDTSLVGMYDQWITLKKIIAEEYKQPASDRREDMLELEERANVLERKLENTSTAMQREKAILNTRWTDIEPLLKENEVAIEFATFQYHNNARWSDTNMLVAFVLEKGSPMPLVVYLCDTRRLDSLMNRSGRGDATFISGLYRAVQTTGDMPSSAYGKKLFEMVWKPLDPYLSPGNHVYFAPSGILNQVAFAAIPGNDQGVLSDRYVLTQVGSTALKAIPLGFDSSVSASLMIFGGIQYDATEAELSAAVEAESAQSPDTLMYAWRDSLRGSSWSFLPATLTEANAVAAVPDSNVVKVNLYPGLHALEETYKEEVLSKAPGIIHIATHSFFFPDPKRKARYENETDRSAQFSQNALYSSGLIFAGANTAWTGNPVDGIEDGILTAYEAAGVSMRNTSLVVLSNCDTRLGEIKANERVLGLQRAFRLAGTEYLLMSLWKMPDVAITEFMTLFYTGYYKSKSIEEAFLEAQNQMRKKYKDEPYKWAAFVLVR
jgi:tetratricopeptide (TPR) repeat protein